MAKHAERETLGRWKEDDENVVSRRRWESFKEAGVGCMECAKQSSKMMTRCPLDSATWRL